MNKYICTGRLAGDVELREVGATKLAKFRLAVQGQSVKNKTTGEWEDRVVWWDCQLWGDRAERFAQAFVKGDVVELDCEVNQDEWEDKNGGGKRTNKTLFVLSYRRGLGTVSKASFNEQGSAPSGKSDKAEESKSTRATKTTGRNRRPVEETVPPDQEDSSYGVEGQDDIPF